MSFVNNARIEGKLKMLLGRDLQVDFKDLYEGPRYEKRAKTRRFNKLLNFGIAIVFVGIVFFGFKLLFGGGSESVATDSKEDQPIMSANDLKDTSKKDDEADSENDESNTEDVATPEEDTMEEVATVTEETEVKVENSSDPNVKETIVNNAWRPIGTSQAEPHVTTYDKASQDWKEMVKTLEYATGLTEQDMTLWRIGNGGSPQHAQAVVSTKDRKYVYRVQMEWVKNEGWKPTKLETLNEVPPEYTGKTTKTEVASTEE